MRTSDLLLALTLRRASITRISPLPTLLAVAMLVVACSDTTLDSGDTPGSEDLVGYRPSSLYRSHFPTERKNLNGSHTLRNVGLPRGVSADDLVVETIDMPFPVLLYTREPDEIFVMGGTPLGLELYTDRIDGVSAGGSETAPYFAKYDPTTGEITYLDLDRGTGLPYLGGAVVHGDGYVYVVSQSHLYKVEPESMVIEASMDLPVPDPATVYNGLITGRTGELILKSLSFAQGDTTLLLVDGDTMEITFRADCDCASARLSLAVDENDVEYLYHINRERTFRYAVEPGSLTLDESWIARFDPDGTGVNPEPTSPLIHDGRVYYTTNTSFLATTPMRVFWQDVEAVYTPDGPPLTGPLLFDDPEGRTGYSFSGLAVDEATGVFLANDQGRGFVTAFRPRDDGGIDRLWQRELRVSSASTVVSDRQMIYATDFVGGSNHLVVLNLMTGDELLRVPTPATRATIGAILLTPEGDAYLASNESGRPTGFLVRVRVRD